MLQIFKKIFVAFTKNERVVFWTAGGIGAVSLLSLIGIAVGAATKVVPTAGGEYTEGLVGQPVNVNPILATSENDKILVRLLFGNLEDVADKIETDPASRNWKIRLKEDIRWSDGEKLTSDDVIFTVQKIQDPASASPLFLGWQGVAVNRLSELELQFTLANPYAFFNENIGNLYILPKHLFAEVPSSNWRLSEYNLKPVGNGPYEFQSYDKDKNGFINLYKLGANSRYFRSRPLIQDFAVRFFPKMDDLAKAFNSGAIDGFSGPDPETIGKIKRSYEALSFAMPIYYAVFLNQGQNIALRELSVRRALSLAVNRKILAEKIFNNLGTPLTGIIKDSEPPADRGIEDPVGIANRILDEAGWPRGDSGFREKVQKNSKVPLEINLTVPQIQFLVATAEELKSSWTNLGIKTTLTILPPEEISERVIKNRDYQALLFGNVPNPPHDLYSFWHSSERFYPGLNLAIYNNKKADELIESVRQDSDPQRRADKFNQLVGIIEGDYPAVFLYSPSYLFIASKDLKGVESATIADPADRFLGVENWYLKTARVLK